MKLSPVNTLGDECKTLAGELLQQPELLRAVFSETQKVVSLADELDAVIIKRYTGLRSTADDERLLMVGAFRLLGASDREIEKACGVTRRTIPVLLAELERTGRVTPLKDRLMRLVGDNAERSGMVLRRLLDEAMDGKVDMDLAAMIKSVGGVNTFMVEKFQLLTGAATERIEHVPATGRAEIESWLKDAATPIDSESSALPLIVEETAISAPLVTDSTPAIDVTEQPAPESGPNADPAGGGSSAGGHSESPMG